LVKWNGQRKQKKAEFATATLQLPLARRKSFVVIILAAVVAFAAAAAACDNIGRYK